MYTLPDTKPVFTKIDPFELGVYMILPCALSFVLIGVMIPIFYCRDPPNRRRAPFPITNALEKLYSVAEIMAPRVYKPEDGVECAICLGAINDTPQEQNPPPQEGIELEEGLGRGSVTTTTTTTTTAARETVVRRMQPTNHEILRLNECGHTFHAQCLCAWFLTRRGDCPLCRRIFYPLRGRRVPPASQAESA